MNFLKKNGGFTLVELIVVIAILAILAGVAVPAYSGYVEKANKQADITLVREAANALILHHYANTEAGPLVVVLNPEGTAASADGESAKAMEAVFGADWANSVGLKYEWAGGAANMAAVNNSNYMQTGTISEKMQDVQSLANKATDFLNLKQSNPENMYNKLGLYLGDGFYDFCEDNGITSADGKFTNASSEQLTNLMGLYVAEDMSNVDAGFYDLVLEDAMLGKGLNSTTATESVNQTTYLAAKYAMFCSIAAGTGEAGQARLDAVDAALGEATNVGQVEAALGKFFEDWSSDTDFMASVENYYANDFAADTQAISSIMGVASDQAKNYYEDATDLDTGDFFTSPSVTAGLNSYMSAAQQLGSLNVGAGAVVLYTDGVTPHVVVTPGDAYLID